MSKVSVPKYFEFDNHSFCFTENPNYKRGGFESKYRLMLYNPYTANYETIAYPDSLKSAKKMAKEFIIIGA